jgi:hypothetical protein
MDRRKRLQQQLLPQPPPNLVLPVALSPRSLKTEPLELKELGPPLGNDNSGGELSAKDSPPVEVTGPCAGKSPAVHLYFTLLATLCKTFNVLDLSICMARENL